MAHPGPGSRDFPEYCAGCWLGPGAVATGGKPDAGARHIGVARPCPGGYACAKGHAGAAAR